VAGRRIIVVVQVVIPKQFFAGGDVADGKNPHPVLDLIHFAVGIAGMIQVGAHAFTVDDGLSVVEAIKVSAVCALIQAIGFLRGQPRTGILNNAGTFTNRRSGKNTRCMNSRGTNNQWHPTNFARAGAWKEVEKRKTNN
jgi:hypothetical protein